ncbi:hypothetical protein [Paenibacillus sp.]|uniref:hypothetical protein n=1 Tax=Paenibacillus sp. TaxID=58172 RepID=UPI002D4CF03A|nr:hypothetical protein [Paenibacillus sp.]HZG87298.1 hypothetical protein [Paenibacillus sp.]
MEVTHDQDGFTYIKYREDKRPLKLAVYYLRDDDDSESILDEIIGYVLHTVNKPKHLAKMEESKFFALIERTATMFCKAYSPSKRYNGLTKPEIRGAIYWIMLGGINAGDEWPDSFRITSETFVQRAEGYR